MGKVSLDMSEYKLMEQRAEELKQSLEREKALSNEIKALNSEKIDLLEKSEKTVTIVKRVYKTETIVAKKSVESIVKGMRNASTNAILRLVSSGYQASIDFFGSLSRNLNSRDKDMIRTYLNNLFSNRDFIDYYQGNIDDYLYNHGDFWATFFDKKIIELTPQECVPEITYKGLDVVKEELREEESAKLKKEAKEAIKNIPMLRLERDECLEKNKTLKKTIKNLQRNEETLIEKLSYLESEMSKLKADTMDNLSKLEQINLVASQKRGIFTSGNKQLKEINFILNNHPTNE